MSFFNKVHAQLAHVIDAGNAAHQLALAQLEVADRIATALEQLTRASAPATPSPTAEVAKPPAGKKEVA
jgi:hypothetical protein